MIYQSVNQSVLMALPAGAISLLDVGCGGGIFGSAVKSSRRCRVVGVTYSEAEAAEARQHLDHVTVADLNHFDPQGLGRFDCIVCSHVLEHLLDPPAVLTRLRACLAPGGVLVVAVPNPLFWRQRLQFALGRFRYTDGGLMDRTHVRFFDWDSASRLLEEAGFEVASCAADGGGFPLSSRLGASLSRSIDRWAQGRFPGLFGFQFVLQGRLAAVTVPPAAPGVS